MKQVKQETYKNRVTSKLFTLTVSPCRFELYYLKSIAYMDGGLWEYDSRRVLLGVFSTRSDAVKYMEADRG